MNGFTQEAVTDTLPRNTFFAEFNLNQNIDFYTILYDRILKPKGKFKIGIQAGLSISTEIEKAEKGFTTYFPIKGYFLLGKQRHFFEPGFGFKISDLPYPEFNIGYRFKPIDNGLSFRAGYIGMAFFGGFENMISLSAGYTF